MKFKALRHNILPDTFGVLRQIRDIDTEIYHSSLPQLLGIGATMEDIRNLQRNTTAFEQLKDYNLVTVQITVLD